jgi:hypothetical protein
VLLFSPYENGANGTGPNQGDLAHDGHESSGSGTLAAMRTEGGRGDAPGGAGLREAVLRGTLRRRLGRGRSAPFAPTALDDELLAVADEAVARRRPLGVVLPFPGTPAPILLGTATLVGAIRRTGALDVEVAVVSPRLSARELYEELTFDDQRISDFIPRTTVGPDGIARVVGRPGRDTGGRLHIANDLSRVRGTMDRLQGIVVDGQAATASELDRLLAHGTGVPVVYLTADPFDPGLERIRAVGGLVWGWDAQSLGELSGPAARPRAIDAGPLLAPSRVLAGAAAAEVVIWEPAPGRDHGFDDALRLLWDALWQLSRSYGASPGEYGAADAMRWAWGVYNLLALLPIRPGDYDRWVGANPYALRLGQSPVTARAYAWYVTGPVRDAWRVFGGRLEDALAAAEAPEKLSRLREWVNDRREPGCGLLAARNRIAAAAVAAALDESPATRPDWRSYTTVTSLQDLAAGKVPLTGLAEICLTGPVQRSRAGLLAIPPGVSLIVLAAGPFEAQRITSQVIGARSALAAIRAEAATTSAGALDITVPARPPSAVSEAPVKVYRAGSTRAVNRAPAETGQNPWEPFDADVLGVLKRSIGGEADETAVPPARVTGGAASASVPAIVISLRDAGNHVLLAGPNDLITRARGAAPARVAAKSLRAGDVIYLVDRNARRDLFTAMTDKLAEAQAYATLTDLIDFWHGRAGWLRGSDLTYEEIYRRMGSTEITSFQTVGTWIRGDVDGPQDPEDVARFARAVGDEALLEEAQRVGWALKTVHVVNRKAGRWLSSRLTGASLRQEDTFVDQSLGIRVTDLLEAVTSVAVEGIDLTARTAPASSLGVPLTRAEAARLVQPQFSGPSAAAS